MTTPNQKTGHTPTPWKATGTQIQGANGYGVASTGFNTGRAIGEKDATFIVRSCNSHDALVGRCESLVTVLQNIMIGNYSPSEQVAMCTKQIHLTRAALKLSQE